MIWRSVEWCGTLSLWALLNRMTYLKPSAPYVRTPGERHGFFCLFFRSAHQPNMQRMSRSTSSVENCRLKVSQLTLFDRANNPRLCPFFGAPISTNYHDTSWEVFFHRYVQRWYILMNCPGSNFLWLEQCACWRFRVSCLNPPTCASSQRQILRVGSQNTSIWCTTKVDCSLCWWQGARTGSWEGWHRGFITKVAQVQGTKCDGWCVGGQSWCDMSQQSSTMILQVGQVDVCRWSSL